MQRLHRTWIAIAVLVVIAWTAEMARADYPSYLILRTPATGGHSHAGPGSSPGRGYAVSGRPYAYGWFGTRSRSHWARHHGYYGNFTQWARQ